MDGVINKLADFNFESIENNKDTITGEKLSKLIENNISQILEDYNFVLLGNTCRIEYKYSLRDKELRDLDVANPGHQPIIKYRNKYKNDQASLSKERIEFEEGLKNDLAELEGSYEESRKQMEVRTKKLENEYNNEIKKLEVNVQESQKQLTEELNKNKEIIEEIAKAHEIKIAEMTKDFSLKQQEIEKAHELKVKEMANDFMLKQQELEKTHALKIAEMNTYSLKQQEIEKTHELKVKEMANDFMLKQQELEKAHDLKIAEMDREYSLKQQEIEKAHKLKIAEISNGYVFTQQELEKAHDLKIAEIQKHYTLENRRFEIELESADKEWIIIKEKNEAQKDIARKEVEVTKVNAEIQLEDAKRQLEKTKLSMYIELNKDREELSTIDDNVPSSLEQILQLKDLQFQKELEEVKDSIEQIAVRGQHKEEDRKINIELKRSDIQHIYKMQELNYSLVQEMFPKILEREMLLSYNKLKVEEQQDFINTLGKQLSNLVTGAKGLVDEFKINQISLPNGNNIDNPLFKLLSQLATSLFQASAFIPTVNNALSEFGINLRSRNNETVVNKVTEPMQDDKNDNNYRDKDEEKPVDTVVNLDSVYDYPVDKSNRV